MWPPVPPHVTWAIQQVVHPRPPGPHGLCFLTTRSHQDTITLSDTLHYARVGGLNASSLPREPPFFMCPPLLPSPRASGEPAPTARGSGGNGQSVTLFCRTVGSHGHIGPGARGELRWGILEKDSLCLRGIYKRLLCAPAYVRPRERQARMQARCSQHEKEACPEDCPLEREEPDPPGTIRPASSLSFSVQDGTECLLRQPARWRFCSFSQTRLTENAGGRTWDME